MFIPTLQMFVAICQNSFKLIPMIYDVYNFLHFDWLVKYASKSKSLTIALSKIIGNKFESIWEYCNKVGINIRTNISKAN